MINCHMHNQIQFPKVGNDKPRTRGRNSIFVHQEEEKKEEIKIRKGRSLAQPPSPFLILTIANRINTIRILFAPRGTELQLYNFCSCRAPSPAVSNVGRRDPVSSFCISCLSFLGGGSVSKAGGAALKHHSKVAILLGGGGAMQDTELFCFTQTPFLPTFLLTPAVRS